MKTLRALFGILIVVAMVYSAYKLLPPYFNNYQFQDAMETEARVNSYTAKPDQDIRETIFKKAKEYDIPVTPEQINVLRNGAELQIWTDYSIHVDLPLYPVDLKFHPASTNKRI